MQQLAGLMGVQRRRLQAWLYKLEGKCWYVWLVFWAGYTRRNAGCHKVFGAANPGEAQPKTWYKVVNDVEKAVHKGKIGKKS